ncbi:gliding motility-associated C-terminal domain-containing protein [Xylanibacter ruminicola]|uniref:Gliding motility-associated C-terminal domain-containing protein n=1 Tax=Xylanibacter ruminicola TaxID=839 RepID=A0A1M6TAI6_XYLRU|nr:gliding motility-associated C-terminal domain-containing protein [Xylanibacter ruminicola]SHK53758.1 gliding motility-associated C-terminal domain-containing protein [Xylanibacter ruminicola]
MRFWQIILTVFAMLTSISVSAQSVEISAIYVDDNGVETETRSDFGGQAPLSVSFRANPTDMEGLNPTYEWHFRIEGESKDMMVRYEENTDYTFTKAGKTYITLYANLGNEERDSSRICVTISESKLLMPNAFSPNEDGHNDIYKAKEYQSIVEFHAYIYNRWGQKLYDWTNPAEGWDGTHNGKPVKEGVYFVVVKARGADGIIYNIRKDVNLLRGFTQSEN